MRIYRTSGGNLIEDEAGCHAVSADLLERLFQSGKGELPAILAAEERGEVISGSRRALGSGSTGYRNLGCGCDLPPVEIRAYGRI